MAKIGQRVHEFPIITDADIWLASQDGWTPQHEDAPTADECCDLRRLLEKQVGQKLPALCLIWLRNTFVQIRKSGTRPDKQDNPPALF